MTVEVTIPEAKDLSFRKMDPHNAPEMLCHFCGKKSIPDGNWMSATFAPIVGVPGGLVILTACSNDCAEMIRLHPGSNAYLILIVDMMMKSMGFTTPVSASAN